MNEIPYLSNVIASHDVSDINLNDKTEEEIPFIFFSPEQLAGEKDCFAVGFEGLTYAANARIQDTGQFTDALIETAMQSEELFFEADYREFISAFPFEDDPDIMRIGILVVPSHEGFRFQAITCLSDNSLRHDPYCMFLPIEKIEAARSERFSDDYSEKILNSLIVEFPGAPPTPNSPLHNAVVKSIPSSAIMATVGISLMALKAEAEARREDRLPVIQQGSHMPRIVELNV